MIIAKLVLFASPLIAASMLFVANPAAASVIDSDPTTHINSLNSQPTHEFLTLNQVDNSNPIIDQLGCNCAYCAGAESPLQGTLPFSNL